MASKRAEYNRDVGRTTELELEVTQHHRPKDKFDFKFEEVMYPREMHSTKAPRYKHRSPTCFLPGNRNSFRADFLRRRNTPNDCYVSTFSAPI